MALCIHSHNTAALSDAWAQHALGSSYNQPIKVIQLEEVEAPPPMPHRSNTSDTSVPYSDSDDSEDDYDEDEDMSESEEEESECSSYCSSDAEDMQERNIAVYDDTYGTRLSRVLAWRDNYAKAIGLLPDDSEYIILFFQLSEPTPPFHSPLVPLPAPHPFPIPSYIQHVNSSPFLFSPLFPSQQSFCHTPHTP